MELKFMKLELCVQWNSLSLNSRSTVSKNCFHRLILPLLPQSFLLSPENPLTLSHSPTLPSLSPPTVPNSASPETRISPILNKVKLVSNQGRTQSCWHQELGDLHIRSCWSILTSACTEPLSQLFRTFVYLNTANFFFFFQFLVGFKFDEIWCYCYLIN